MIRRDVARGLVAGIMLALLFALLGSPAAAAPSDTHSIGNLVFDDYSGGYGENNGYADRGDGVKLRGDDGIDGVVVELLSAAGTVLAEQTTVWGYYRFDGLATGTYRVRLAARNFVAGGPLHGLQSSSYMASGDMTRSGNFYDHGLDDGTDPVEVGISSGAVALGPADPFSDIASDEYSPKHSPNGDGHDNLVVDFGVVPAPPPSSSPLDWDLDVVDAAPGPHAVGSTVELRSTLRQLGPGNGQQDSLRVGISYPEDWTLLAEEDDEPCFGTGDLPQGDNLSVFGFGTGPCSSNPSPVGGAGYTFAFSLRFRVDARPFLISWNIIGNLTTNEQERSTTNNRVELAVPATPTDGLLVVGDRVWADDDADGLQDPGEGGVSGARVELLDARSRPAVDAEGTLVEPSITRANGYYGFGGLAAGQYRLRVRRNASTTAAPFGYWFTKGQQGDASLDSDTGTTGISPVFALSPSSPHVVPPAVYLDAGYTDPTVDAGLQPLFALGNRVWLDADADGRQDSGEASLAGAQIRLTTADGAPARHADGTLVAPVRTAANGYYIITGLPRGSYVVTIADIRLCSSATPPTCSVVPPTAGKYRFSPTRAAGATAATNSDVDANGRSKPVLLAVGAPDVVRSDTNALNAVWKNSTVDAGIVLE